MKYVKITGCHDSFCPVYKFKTEDGMVCHRITYKAEIGKEPFNEIQKHIDNETIHPDCPLDDLVDPLDAMGVKIVLFKMSQRVRSGQFDSRSFVGDIALELRGLLFKNEESFWREYDEWEIK